MAEETYIIRRRSAWEFMGGISVTIECDPLAPSPVKLGLAVSAAVKSGANLSGANLSGADLARAYLAWADLSRANLSGANLYGEKIKRLIARADRGDGYQFMALELEGGGYKIKAGCRWFTMAEFRAHTDAEYPDTDKHRETNDILDFIEARARAHGVTDAPDEVEVA